MDSGLNNQNDQWELKLDIDDLDLRLTLVMCPCSSTRVETSTTTKKPLRIILGLAVVEDEDFKSGSWVSAIEYVNANVGIVSGCLGDIKNFLKNGKLDQVVAVVKSYTPNVLGDLTMTLKDLSEDVEPEPNLPLQKIIILDPDDRPMWESAKIVAPTPNSVIVQPNVDDNFVINNTHLKMIHENKFDGYLRAYPHDHIREFLAICDMFKYGETQSEAVKLLMFPFSLYDKAKTWFDELNEESITSWEQMRKYFINKFFPPSLFNRLLLEIRNFSQLVC
ncbi:reverse transcriptase domain-containing protein [Tanacetum coccineum]